MTIEGLTAIGLAPPAEGIPPPLGASSGDPFAQTFAAAVAANAGKTGVPGTASSVSVPPGLLVDPNQPWLALLGTPAIEGAPTEPGAVEIVRPDRAAEADIEDAMMASTLALAGLLGLERPIVTTPTDGTPSGASGDVTLLVAEGEVSMPVIALEVAADGGGTPASTPEVAANGSDTPVATPASAPKVDGSSIEVPLTEAVELALPKPEAGVNRAAAATIDAPSSASAAVQAAGVTVESVQSRRPGERLGETLQDVPPADRAEVASAWNRAGGWRADGTATDTSSGNVAGVEVVEASSRGAAADPADASTGRADGAETLTAGQAAQVSAAEPRVEVNTAAASTVDATIDARDGRELVRSLADTVHRATRAGENELRLVLNPPELGRLDVRIEHGQNGVRVLLSADSAKAHDLIQQHLPALRAALEVRDLRVDRLDVQTSDSSSNLGDSGDQTQRRQGGDDEEPRWSSVAAMEQREQRATGDAPTAGTRTRGGGVLDLVA